MDIKFTVPGPPKSKARHRTTKEGIQYTPKETVQYENLVKMGFREKYKGEPWQGPVVAKIVAIYPIPKSASKAKRQLMEYLVIRPHSKPDCDNIAKVILDSLNQIAFRDDAQVYMLAVSKMYGTTPQVWVQLIFQEGSSK